MELILNTNELGFQPFLEEKIDSIIIGLKDYCINQPFSISLREIPFTIELLKKHSKKFYLSINLFAMEKDIKPLKKIIKKIANLPIDGYIVSDLGVLNIFKELSLERKVILDLQTYITNKYSAKSLLNLGINRVVLSKEITLNDIKEITNFTKGNIELLCQGYYPITYSKRPILSCYYKNFKQKKESDLHFIKEESRENYYFLVEKNNNLSVFNDKQYSLFNNLIELNENKINHLRIDTLFLSEEEIKQYIYFYSTAINYIENKKIEEFGKLKEEFNNKFDFDMPFLHNESFLLKEDK